jgi:DNA-binding CsgD family transcriptional regulator
MTIDELVERARAFQQSRALLTALELDLFTAVGDGATAEQVAARLETDPRATAMLLNALADGCARRDTTRWSVSLAPPT